MITRALLLNAADPRPSTWRQTMRSGPMCRRRRSSYRWAAGICSEEGAYSVTPTVLIDEGGPHVSEDWPQWTPLADGAQSKVKVAMPADTVWDVGLLGRG